MGRIFDDMGRELVTCKVCGALHLKSECIAINSPKLGFFYFCIYFLKSLKNEKNDKIKKLVITNYFLLTCYYIISII